jgi:hypothetical protein
MGRSGWRGRWAEPSEPRLHQRQERRFRLIDRGQHRTWSSGRDAVKPNEAVRESGKLRGLFCYLPMHALDAHLIRSTPHQHDASNALEQVLGDDSPVKSHCLLISADLLH